MKRILDITIKLLVSTFFFLSVVVVGTVVGSKYLMDQDARNVLAGDKPHSFFRVLVLNRENQLVSMPLETWGQPQLGEQRLSPWLPPGKGKHVEAKKIRYQYEVLAVSEKVRRVEIKYADGDRSALWKYDTTPDAITPMYSKVTSLGYLFQALPFSLVIAFLLNLIGKVLRLRLDADKTDTGE